MYIIWSSKTLELILLVHKRAYLLISSKTWSRTSRQTLPIIKYTDSHKVVYSSHSFLLRYRSHVSGVLNWWSLISISLIIQNANVSKHQFFWPSIPCEWNFIVLVVVYLYQCLAKSQQVKSFGTTWNAFTQIEPPLSKTHLSLLQSKERTNSGFLTFLLTGDTLMQPSIRHCTCDHCAFHHSVW
jgi:hypothetical protein